MVIDRTNKVDGTSGVQETVKEIIYLGVHLNGEFTGKLLEENIRCILDRDKWREIANTAT